MIAHDVEYPYLSSVNLSIPVFADVLSFFRSEDRPANSNASDATPGDPSVGQGGSPGIPGGIFGGTTTVNISDSASESSPPQQKRTILRGLWYSLKRMLWKRQADTDIAGSQLPTLVANGVEFAPDSQSIRQTVSATREVIVAAGSLHSPHLLMLSGVGPSTHLQQLNIPTNIDLPGVGSNLQE